MWRGAYVARGGSVPGGYEPEDFALDAFQKALDDEDGRTWNRATYPTLEGFLRSIINSDISHLVNSIDNAQGRRLSAPSGKDETVRAYEVPGTEDDPLQIVVDRDRQQSFQAEAMKELDGDEFLIELLKCLDAEITEPSELAILMGKTVDDINNGKKRLRRKLDRLDTRVKPAKKRTGS